MIEVTLRKYGLLRWTSWTSPTFIFCAEEFERYFALGNATEVTLHLSSQPSADSYLLKLSADGCWEFGDVTAAHANQHGDSPWPLDFDLFLDKHFKRQVYVSLWLT